MRLFTVLLGALMVHVLVGALPAQAERCTRVIQQGGSEYIVNTCNACRKVNIRRKRRGIAMPVMRTYDIHPQSKFRTSFKGVGRSRITSEILCEGAQGASTNIMDPKARTLCGSDVAGMNCNDCRSKAVEHIHLVSSITGPNVMDSN